VHRPTRTLTLSPWPPYSSSPLPCSNHSTFPSAPPSPPSPWQTPLLLPSRTPSSPPPPPPRQLSTFLATPPSSARPSLIATPPRPQAAPPLTTPPSSPPPPPPQRPHPPPHPLLPQKGPPTIPLQLPLRHLWLRKLLLPCPLLLAFYFPPQMLMATTITPLFLNPSASARPPLPHSTCNSSSSSSGSNSSSSGSNSSSSSCCLVVHLQQGTEAVRKPFSPAAAGSPGCSETRTQQVGRV